MQIVLLVVALSVDVFVASMACGTEHIEIPRKTALCISIICSGVLFLSLVAGNLLHGILRKETAAALGFTGLLLVGIYKLAEYGVKVYIRKHTFLCKRVKITFSQIQFILSIYNNPIEADKDRSATMSVAEGAFLALAMSLDGFFGGLGASFLGMNIWITTLVSLMLGYVAVEAGSYLGRHIALYSKKDFSWVSGLLFVILAFSKVL